ncbi:hypothetical protein [Williamsia phyllosphaerae]|uniref:hypothetical protein n=1 Tax=Williamsia phyllosphaerae TaxID=885042 RepID=UPI001663519B|nr:hypothetical protein [Williamsia phyllosphaerae]
MRRLVVGLVAGGALFLHAGCSNDPGDPTLVLEIGGDYEFATYSDSSGNHDFERGQTRVILTGDEIPESIFLQVLPFLDGRAAKSWCKATLDGVVQYEAGSNHGALCSEFEPTAAGTS